MHRKFLPRSNPSKRPKENFLDRLLDPLDRLSETIYSVLIALLFTLVYRILMLREGVTFSSGYGIDLSGAILGAVLAWGIIDGMMYALLSIFERGEQHRMHQRLQTADSEETAVAVIAEELDYWLEPLSSQDQRRSFYHDILDHMRNREMLEIGLQREDVQGALGSVLVAVLAVLPSVVPLLLLPGNVDLAIRISNIISFIILFSTGYSWGKHTSTNPWLTGLLVMSLGLIMVMIAILLGG